MSTQADRNPAHLYEPFRTKYLTALQELNKYLRKHRPEWSSELGEGFRSTERQKALYAQGRTVPGPIVTRKNGTTNKSNHQSSMAADAWFRKGGKITFSEPPKDVTEYYGHCLRAQGLDWGGDWKGGFVDRPHAEWPVSDTGSYRNARKWQKGAGLV